MNKKQAYLKGKWKSERNDPNPVMTQNLELTKKNVTAHIILYCNNKYKLK